MQITASNLVGIHGEQKQRLCKSLIEQGMGHIIASDAHGASGTRIPAMRGAFDEARKLIGQTAKNMFYMVPESIVND